MIGREIQLLDGSLSKVAVLWNPYMSTSVRYCRIDAEVEGPDKIFFGTADFAWRDELSSDATTYYLRVIGLYDPTEIRTYQLSRPEVVRRGGEKLLALEGERIWIHLQNRYRYEFSKEFVNLPLGSLLETILDGSGADGEFQIGTVENSSEVVDFFALNFDSPLYAFRALNAKMGREMAIDETASPITLNFPVQIGEENGARLRYGTNLQGVTRTNDKTQRVTRMYGVGGGQPALTVASSGLGGATNYIDSVNFHATNNNYVGRYENPDLQDWTNIIPEAKHPDLSGTYAGGLCTGWEKIGTPTCEENLDPDHIEYGTKSQKVTATDGQGVKVAFTGIADADLVRWANVKILSRDGAAVLRVEMVDGAGATTFNDVEDIGAMIAVQRQGARYTNTAFEFKFYALGGAVTFVVDAALVAEGQAFVAFVVGSMADILYRETENELAKHDGDTAGVTYAVEALDLFEIDPEKYPDYRIGLGDEVVVEDLDLDLAETLRVRRVSLDIIEALANTYDVGLVKNSIARVLDVDARALRDGREFVRAGQAGLQKAGGALSSDRPVVAQVARFSGDLASTTYDSLSWGSGTLDVGVGTRYPINSGSLSGLTASTPHWLYFDLDDPGAFKITTVYASSIGARKASVAYVRTGASTDAGLEIIRADGRPQLSGNSLVVGRILTNVCDIESPGTIGLHIDSTGIYSGPEYGDEDSTFGIRASDGAAYFMGELLAGSVVSAEISADLITAGTLAVGGAAEDDRIELAWATQDFRLYRGGNEIVTVGDLSDTFSPSSVGALVNHPNGGYAAYRTGAAVGSLPSAFAAQVFRGEDEVAEFLDQGYFAGLSAQAPSSGLNAPLQGYSATIANLGGPAIGFGTYYDSSILGYDAATGLLARKVRAIKADGVAIGLHIDDIEGGATGGLGVGIKIENNLDGDDVYVIQSLSTAPSVLAGDLSAARLFAGSAGFGEDNPDARVHMKNNGAGANLCSVYENTADGSTWRVGIAAVNNEYDFQKWNGSSYDRVLRLYAAGALVRGAGGATGPLTILNETGGTGLQSNIRVFMDGNPDDTTSTFFRCFSNVSSLQEVKLTIFSNGDVENENGVYGTISDERLKEDIVPARSYWDDIKSLEFCTYFLRRDRKKMGEDAPRLFGLRAQQVAQVFPSLVYENEDGDLGLKKSIIHDIVCAAFVEAQHRIESLEARVAALEAA